MENRDKKQSGRGWLVNAGAVLFLIAIIGLVGYFISRRESAVKLTRGDIPYQEAAFYEKLGGNRVQCGLCPNRCILSDGQFGQCKARQNIGGSLYSLVYGRAAAEHVDPIEKKPFYHFLPGSKAYSVGTTGCNLSCLQCQNWEISQKFPDETTTKTLTPEQAVAEALRTGSRVIAFTYNEPTVNYEYVLATAKLAREKGLRTVIVSNGYINREPMEALLPYLDAVKIDIKGFSEAFYRKFTQGKLQPVLDTAKLVHDNGKWLEIVYLVIPGENDDDEQLRGVSRWIKESLGDGVPLHFSRFHPDYKLQNVPATPIATLFKARQIALEAGLKHVYIGNVPDDSVNSTYCPDGSFGIRRNQFFVTENNLRDGRCPDGSVVPGVWR